MAKRSVYSTNKMAKWPDYNTQWRACNAKWPKRSGVTIQTTPLHQHHQVRYPSTSYNGQFCLLCFQPQPFLASLSARIPTVSTVTPLLIVALVKDVPAITAWVGRTVGELFHWSQPSLELQSAATRSGWNIRKVSAILARNALKRRW